MPWHLEGKIWRAFLISSTFSLVCASASHAQSSNSLIFLERPNTNTRIAGVKNNKVESNQQELSDAELPNSLVLLEVPDQLMAEAANRGSNPNQERFLQPETTPKPLQPENQEIIPSQPTPEISPETVPKNIRVDKIEVTGSTIFSQEQLNSLTKVVEGRSVRREKLTEITKAITKLYVERGYITSKAILPNQKIKNGVVQIVVIEGGIEKIVVEGTKRLNPNYVRLRVALGVRQPLSTIDLEEHLRLLKANPLFSNLESSLRKGTQPGKNILVVKVTEANPFQASLTVDNYSPPSIGSERLGINTIYQNLTGLGDQLAASYYFTAQGGSNIYNFSYRVPVNGMNGTLQLRTEINNNEVIQEPFQDFDIRGASQLYEISFRQPLVRSLRQEFALSLGLTIQNGQTFTFAGPTAFGLGPDDEGNSRTRVIKFGQDYLARDLQGAWSLRSLFSLGIDIFNATKNANPIPDGQFFSWLGQVQRVQRFNKNNLLIAQAEVQLTPNGLLPSQQFVIGGGQSVRGYRQNARAADNGVRFLLENQLTLYKGDTGLLKVAPFFNLGYVWNTNDNPNRLQRQTFLAGTGVGVLWQFPPHLSMRLDYGLPLIDLDDRGVNAQDEGFYFSVGYKL